MNLTKKVLNFLILFFILSCSSLLEKPGYKTKELDYPLTFVKATVQDTIPGKLDKISKNGREYYSNWMIMPTSFRTITYRGKGPWPERIRYVITILGAERPYTLNVRVPVELYEYGKYEQVDRLKELEELLAKKLVERLVQRSEKSNFIDDFRPF